MGKRRTKKKKRISIISMFIIVLLVATACYVSYRIIYADEIRWKNLEEALKDIKYPEVSPELIPGTNESSFKNDTTGINQKLIDSIYEKYGIKVYYGSDYTKITDEVEAKPLVDMEKANSNLKKLEILLKKYPKEFFNNLYISDSKRYTVAFYLVENFSNDNIALAQKDNTIEYKLFVSNYEDLEKAVHHEIYHIMEYYMEEKSGKGTLYTKWSQLNPKDFEYAFNIEKITTRYVYNSTLKNKGAYFITNYSKYSGKEDRAEIFADLMIETVKPVYYSEGEPIRKKAEYIVSEMKRVLSDFNLASSYFYRFLK